MGWLKIDDKIASHPKVLQAGPEAAWMWVAAIAYSQNHLTDGFVPTAALPTFGIFATPAQEVAGRLVTVRLFDAVDGGFLVHDYHHQNPTKQDVVAMQKKAAERKAQWRSRGRGSPEGQDGQDNEHVTGVSHVDTGVTETTEPRTSRTRVPTPTPIPTPTVKTQERTATASGDAALLERFDRFWTSYPRKDGRKPAWKVWQRLKPSEATTDLLLAAIARQCRSRQWQDKQFIPHAATWLNQERWEDDAGTAPVSKANGHGRAGLSPVCYHDPPCRDGTDACKQQQLDELKSEQAGH